MSKVYCKNCEWDGGLYFGKQGCCLKRKDTISGRMVCRARHWWDKTKLARDLNINNDCPHYQKKRKWWKFW